jgi:uncharacterized protein YfiM (DUF2279 family)
MGAVLFFSMDLNARALDEDTSAAAPCGRCMLLTGGGLGAGMAGSLVLLDQAWYASYERSPLHAFNDGNEWLQMDKAGHVFSAYTLSSWGTALFERCDPPGRKALWLGSGIGLAFMTGIELLDGTSAAWGFSWWDMAANVTGTGLFVGQELAWGEQRIRVKLSARHTEYAAMRPELLGQGAIERYLKDYNGQTIWLSTNLHAFAPSSALPPWLNVAVGYSSVGMITAEPPPSADALGGDLLRMRRYFLSPDIDLTRIKTRSKAMRTVLFVLNSIKIPAPTLEVTSTGKVVGHWLYF